MPNAQDNAAINTLINTIAQAISASFSQRLSQPWTCEISSDTDRTPTGEPISYLLSITGSVTGKIDLQLGSEDADTIQTRLASATEAGKAEGELEVLLNQAADSASRLLVPTLGQIQFKVSRQEKAPELAAPVVLALKDAEMTILVSISCDDELSDSLMAASLSEIPAQASKGSSNPNVGLIMGVELDVTLRFGQRTLTLGEILNLNAGSVVELDRQVHEPVELLLRDQVIAHGEVVIVDGNYGLRITDVVDAQARVGAL